MSEANGSAAPVVLLVEDDLDVREAVVVTLEDMGYRVLAAGNGREALDRLREAAEPPCVILLDLMMPVMDGWEFRERLRGEPRHAEVPVVALSAHGEADGFEAAAFLRKPVALEPLVATVERFCRTGRGA